MSQQGANAELISRMLDEMGQNISSAIRGKALMDLEKKKLSLQSLSKIKDFMSLPPEKRKALLQDPNFRADIVRNLDPDTFNNRRKVKAITPAEMAQRNQAAMALGSPTGMETQAELEAAAKTQKAQADASLAKLKESIATGVTTPTPMNLLMAGDVKDPLAAALMVHMTSSPQGAEQVKNVALMEKKAGPLYIQQQQQEWYGKMLDQGLPPGVAMQSAIAIAGGRWDQVPQQYTDPKTGQTVPVRGKAEQQLAMDMMNTISKQKEVQGNIENSIATSAAALAEKAGIPLDQARANIMAMRSGAKTPYATPHLQDMAALDETAKKQEIEKNTQTILNDKAGIGTIKEALNSMIGTYKESGMFSGVLTSAQKADLEDKIAQTTQMLTQKLSERYGLQYDKYEDLHPWSTTIKNAVAATWKAGKATGAFGLDVASDGYKALDQTFGNLAQTTDAPFTNKVGQVQTSPSLSPAGVMVRGTGKHTPEQESVLKSLSDQFTAALNDPNTSAEQKQQIQDYVTNKLAPAVMDPSKFSDLFAVAPVAPEPPKQDE